MPLNSNEFIPDIKPISMCHYVYRAMIPNAKNLYTNIARDLAKDKIKILEGFVKKNYNGDMKGL